MTSEHLSSDERTVVIPSRTDHDGYHSMTVTLPWFCIHCGAPRGEPRKGTSYDGSRRIEVDTWQNDCGHVEKYHEVREWIAERFIENKGLSHA